MECTSGETCNIPNSDNEVDSLIDSIITSLAKNSRNSNSSIGFNPTCSIDIPLSRNNFWQIFGSVVPKNLSKAALNIKCSISVREMTESLGASCATYMKPNSCTQIRIFGEVHIELYQRTSKTSSDMKSIYERYLSLNNFFILLCCVISLQ